MSEEIFKQKPRKSITDNRGQELICWIESGYSDYLAARVLLNTGQLLHGGMMACTAIEKYAKATLLLKGDRVHGHLKRAHLNGIRNWNKEQFEALNSEFLNLCQDCYKTRYRVDLPIGFHVEIFQKKFLAELDFTAYEFNARFGISIEGKPFDTDYMHGFKSKDPILYYQNYLMLRLDRASFIAEPQCYYEMKRSMEGWLICDAKAGGVPDDGIFRPYGLDNMQGKTISKLYRGGIEGL